MEVASPGAASTAGSQEADGEVAPGAAVGAERAGEALVGVGADVVGVGDRRSPPAWA
jgi:hypothetical protein